MYRFLLLAMIFLFAFTAAVPINAKSYRQINQFKKKKGKKKKGKKGKKDKSCGEIVFNFAPMAIDDIATILPLGNLNATEHIFPTRHMYFHLNREIDGDFNTPSAKTPVYAPADMSINEITLNMFEKFADAIDVKFSFCKQLSGYFDHMTSLSEKLQTEFDAKKQCQGQKSSQTSNRCVASVKIQIQAGELLGYAGGDMFNNALDFGLFDSRIKKLSFANMNRWKHEDSRHPYYQTVCPVDYYPQDLKEQLENKIGYYQTKRNGEPKCGIVDYDNYGAASGMWFAPNTSNPYPEDPHLSLVYDTLKTEYGVFAVGTNLKDNLSASLYYFNFVDSGFVNRNFDQVKNDGEVYCYETNPGGSNANFDSSTTQLIYIQLLKKDTLRIEGQSGTSCGSGPWSFGSSFVDFER